MTLAVHTLQGLTCVEPTEGSRTEEVLSLLGWANPSGHPWAKVSMPHAPRPCAFCPPPLTLPSPFVHWLSTLSHDGMQYSSCLHCISQSSNSLLQVITPKIRFTSGSALHSFMGRHAPEMSRQALCIQGNACHVFHRVKTAHEVCGPSRLPNCG